jgi:hypothetical protein
MKRAAVFAIPLALVAVLVGRDGGTITAQAAVRHALARTVDARSSRFTLTWSNADFPAPPAFDTKIEGVMDYARRRGRISYFAESEVIFDGDVMYMKWSLPWRKESRWLRWDTGEEQPDPLDLQERALRNPIGLLEFLTGAGRDVRQVGSEEVRGTRSVHYEGTLDFQKVIDQAPAERRAELQVLLDLMYENEPTTVPFGLWVDRDGIARRLRMDQGDGSSVLIEYYDFGIPVEITPPAPSEIVSMEDYVQEISEHTKDSDCGESEFNTESGSGQPELSETHTYEDAVSIGSTTAYVCFVPAVGGG